MSAGKAPEQQHTIGMRAGFAELRMDPGWPVSGSMVFRGSGRNHASVQSPGCRLKKMTAAAFVIDAVTG